MKKLIVAAAFAFTASSAFAAVNSSSHNFPGKFGGIVGGSTCAYCHMPHGGANLAGAPLWARNNGIGAYSFYKPVGASPAGTGATALNTPSQLCMSCHDGTQSVARVLKIGAGGLSSGNQYLGGIANNNGAQITAASYAYVGTNLTNDHPVSISFMQGTPYGGLAATVPAPFMLFNGTGMQSGVGAGTIECLSCHNAHASTGQASGSYPNRSIMLSTGAGDYCNPCHSTK
jgi:hypothetical protein